MKKNMIIIIGAIILILTLSISGIYIIDSFSDLENISTQKIPRIKGCYNTIYGIGEEVTEGYATLRYDYLVINQKNNPAAFEFDWGDGTSSITDNTGDRRFVPHVYSESGTYDIKVRYIGENIWSEPFEINMKDFFDLSVGDIKTNPSEFKPRQNIELSVEITNLGTISSEKTAKISFYYLEGNEPKYIDKTSINSLKPGESKTVEISLKWFKDRDSHTIYVELEELNGERTDKNNIDYEAFTATKLLGFNSINQRPLLTKLLDLFPNCFPVIRLLIEK